MKACSIIMIIIILLFIGGGVFVGYLINEFYFVAPESDTSAVTISIEEGMSVSEIAEKLKSTGIIDSKTIFLLYVKWTGTDTDFKTGVFEIIPGINISNIVAELTADEINLSKATIIEGWTLRGIGSYFENKGMLQAEEIFEEAGLPAVDYRAVDQINPAEKWKSEFTFLDDKPEYVSLEGYLFPDTYYFYGEAGAEDVVKKMLENFDKKLTPQWRAEIDRQGKSIFDIVTMASIIEREMYGLEARKMVSDIFWKRLEVGMPLQSDASVNYVTGKGLVRPSYEDTQVDSPYNTYKYPGLPLGPISNPSAEAIEAAIYPTPNDYYYFLTTPEGEIKYSKTYDEHNENIYKYLR